MRFIILPRVPRHGHSNYVFEQDAGGRGLGAGLEPNAVVAGLLDAGQHFGVDAVICYEV